MSHVTVRWPAPVVLWVCVIGTATAADTHSQTGTRVDSEASNLAVLQLHEPSTVTEVQRLLEQGRTDDAVALAREYVDNVKTQTSVNEGDLVPELYFALNSLCIALTKRQDFDEAVATCGRAIQMRPGRWSAINNRGTAYYAAGAYESALVDYRHALSVAPEEAGIRDTIAHNIALAEGRAAAR
jgi:Flp pilus assembly protein TadD